MKRKDLLIFIIILLFTLIAFKGFLVGHFATDTYNIFNMGYDGYAKEYSLTDGRIIMGLIGYMAYILNIPITLYISILEIFAIITSCLIVVILKNTIIKYKKDITFIEEIILIIACYYTIFNFAYLENMYFAECFVMALSLLLYIIAANQILNIHSKIDYLKIVLLILGGLICYQGTISALFIMVALFSILQDDRGSIVKNLFVTGIAFVIGVLVNSGCIVFFEKAFNTFQTRGISINNIPSNIIFILKNFTKILINTAYLFPKHIYILLITWLLGISYLKLFNSENKRDIILILNIIVLIIFSIGCAFIPSVVNLTGFWAGRMRFSLGALIGIVFIYLIVKTDFTQGKKIYDKALIIFLIVYGIINSLNYFYLINIMNEVNKLDKEYANEINNYINDYEKNNNLNIKNIKQIVINNKTYMGYYSQLNAKGSITTVSAIRTKWSAAGAINYYTKRNLEEKDITKEEYDFVMNNVDNNLQYLCIGDTLYLLIYMY